MVEIVPPNEFALDREQFAEIYSEFGDAVFGACLAILRDRDAAADAMQEVFVLALERISQLHERGRLRPWLFAIARHVSYRRLRAQRRAEAAEVRDPVVDTEAPADSASADGAALIWAAAAGVSERDRAVLFNVVQGLEGRDLAAAIGVRYPNQHVLLYRAKAHLDEAVGALAVTRFGRRDCESLDALLGPGDATLTPALRKRIGLHVDICPTCARTKLRTYEMPEFAAGVLAVAGQGQARSADEIFDVAARSPASDEAWQHDGFPPLDDPGPGRRRLVVLALSALGAGALIVLLTSVLGNTSSAPPALATNAAPAPAADAPLTSPPAATPTAHGPQSTTTVVAGITAESPSAMTGPTTGSTEPQSLISNFGTATAATPNAFFAVGPPRPTAPRVNRRPASPPPVRPPVRPPPTSPPPTSPPPTSPPPTSPPSTDPPPTTPPTTEPPIVTLPPVTVPPITVPPISLPF